MAAGDCATEELTINVERMTEFNLDTAARIVQLALTPVFLLSATATLLGVFATRLARVADRVDSLSHESRDAERDQLLEVLRLRSRVLDTAVVLSALSGGMTCVAVLILFLGEVRGTAAARYLFLSFGGAICLTMAALGAFVMEMLLSARVIRLTVDRSAHKR